MRFPILVNPSQYGHDERGLAIRTALVGCPTSVEVTFTGEHRRQCQRNHGQSPERLAERGGLDPLEFYKVMHGLRWRGFRPRVTDYEHAVAYVHSLQREKGGGP